MEGTRHERVVTVLASYVIGFTTAFILYSSSQVLTQEVFITIPEQSASVVLSEQVEESIPEAKSLDLKYQDGKLEVTVNNESKLLSFNPEVNQFNIEVESLTQGFHYGELKYAISPDNKFIFFCERHDLESESCTGYVYDIAEDMIFPITKEGKEVAISATSAETATWSEAGLNIGSTYSANPSAPWVLISDDKQLDLE